ncbi:hypothetical protein Tsp_00886 [Trichinella spiralis]|uniref:hypothetical protein n=1 Tax=Trichinella spiralis TaxID=6334 RepID=UPI0001EFB4B6|nr:hypothetical protein Tsp_00886 [Trichinella spiralis]
MIAPCNDSRRRSSAAGRPTVRRRHASVGRFSRAYCCVPVVVVVVVVVVVKTLPMSCEMIFKKVHERGGGGGGYASGNGNYLLYNRNSLNGNAAIEEAPQSTVVEHPQQQQSLPTSPPSTLPSYVSAFDDAKPNPSPSTGGCASTAAEENSNTAFYHQFNRCQFSSTNRPSSSSPSSSTSTPSSTSTSSSCQQQQQQQHRIMLPTSSLDCGHLKFNQPANVICTTTTTTTTITSPLRFCPYETPSTICSALPYTVTDATTTTTTNTSNSSSSGGGVVNGTTVDYNNHPRPAPFGSSSSIASLQYTGPDLTVANSSSNPGPSSTTYKWMQIRRSAPRIDLGRHVPAPTTRAFPVQSKPPQLKINNAY